MFLIVKDKLINNVSSHNIPTLFEILSNSFHKIAFINKIRMREMSLFSSIAILKTVSI